MSIAAGEWCYKASFIVSLLHFAPFLLLVNRGIIDPS